jgi:hypothetical protein
MTLAPAAPTAAIFPVLQARNLNGRTFNLPAGFTGIRNIVIVAFHRSHQALVDSWMPALELLVADHPTVRVYELPMIANGYALMRPFIDGGMASAIPSAAVRERTLTVYTNIPQRLAALQITNLETIAILLVDRSGRISWRSEGTYAEDKGASLARILSTR